MDEVGANKNHVPRELGQPDDDSLRKLDRIK
jgi:hypothetical protein